MPPLWRREIRKEMKSYTIKLHEDDVERLCMLKMEMQQDDGNDDWDMICDIFQQIENQRFEEIVRKKNIGYEKEQWVCKECNKSTYQTDYDYLSAKNLHLECAFSQHQALE